MNNSEQSYTTPQLETVDLRATQDVDVHIGGPGPDINVSINLGS